MSQSKTPDQAVTAELAEENQRLRRRVEELEQACSDLDIALATAIEHGDLIEESLYAANAKLRVEMRDRVVAERRLSQILGAVSQQKADLELLVETITEHSDAIDAQWLRRYTAAELLSREDPLTGLFNRREVDARLDAEWRRCARGGHPLALVMADIDHFKDYNDTYGHPRGDAALKRVSEILCGVCHRTADLVGRMGGEEFLLMLPETDAAGARRIAETVRRTVWDADISFADSANGRLTLSMGVAVATPTRDNDWADLLALADNLLYMAKRDGRNAIRFPDDLPEN